jgi:hypothetical protein
LLFFLIKISWDIFSTIKVILCYKFRHVHGCIECEGKWVF